MEALAEITRESKGKSVNLLRNEYFQYVTQQKIPFPSQLYYFCPKDYRYIMDRIPNVHGPLKVVTLGASKCAVIIYRPHLGFGEILNALSNLRQLQGLFLPFARVGSGDPVRVLRLLHNEYTGYTLKHLLLRHMYNLLLPKLCATLLVNPLCLRGYW